MADSRVGSEAAPWGPASGASQWQVILLSWSLRPHLLRYRDNGLVAYAFVLGDHLSAEEKNQGANLYTEQHRDRGRERPVNHLNLRHGRVVPDENVSGDFP